MAERDYGYKMNYSGLNLRGLTRGASDTCKQGVLKGVLKVNLKSDILLQG